MANVSLRAYNREIEGLIGQGRIEEALAHCRHVLKFFPKHVSTYRLLGKAYLESQRYSDAADIFQRVLSVEPDDFVSHVGMSIIREDEGNLDAAIWHMERAFEVQPSNAAIQDELKRLYGKRDGMEPPKIRLTRGALARMYAHGNLYQQAVAELRSALAEDSQRFDLQVLLARMYFENGKPVEAAETCSSVLRKLPYCLKANLILAQVLQQSDRSEEAETYQQRVQELDPYAAYLSSAAPAIEDVPDSAVTIGRLEWEAGSRPSEQASQPDWATSLGISIEEEQAAAEVPDWLEQEEPSEDVEEPESVESPVPAAPVSDEEIPYQEELMDQETEGEEIDAEDVIPAWMKDAGWVTEGEEAEDRQDTVDLPADLTMDAGEEEIAAGDIPDWLHDMAPPGEQPAEPAMDDEDMSGEMPPWLDTKPPGPTDSVVVWLEQHKDQIQEEGPPQEGAEEPPEAVSDEEIPDWLQTLAGEISASDVDAEAAEPTQEESPAPADLPPQAEASPPTAEETLPDWLLEETESEAPPTQVPPAEAPEPTAVEPQASDEEEPEIELEPAEVPEDQDAALAWLESLAAKQGAQEEELVTSPEERVETPPDWVSASIADETGLSEDAPAELETSLAGEAPDGPEAAEAREEPPAAEELPAAAIEEEPEPEPAPDEVATVDEEPMISPKETLYMGESEEDRELPEWLEDLEAEAPAVDAQSAEPVSAEDLPDWLREMEAETPAGADEPISEEEDLPAWMQEPAFEPELADEPDIDVQPEEEQPEAERPDDAQPEEVPSDAYAVADLGDQESALAWLEGLAADQGAEDEELITSPEQRTETPPDWVHDTLAEQEIPAAEMPEESEDEEVEGEPIPETPDWMRETMVAGWQEEEEGDLSEDDIPDWMRETAISRPSTPPDPEAIDEEDWSFETIAPETDVGEEREEEPTWALDTGQPEEPEPVGALPDMEEAEPEDVETPEPTTEAAAEEPVEEDLDEIPAWILDTEELEVAEVEPPVQEEAIQETVEPEPTEEEVESAPEWLLETELPEEVGPAEPETPEPEEVLSREAPDEDVYQPLDEELETIPPDEVEEMVEEELETLEYVSATEAAADEVAVEEPEETAVPLEAEPLQLAQEALSSGEMERAVEQYQRLIRKGRNLEEVVDHLRDALYRHPVDIDLWETLGDSYAKADRLQEALDAYTKAEELLR